MRFERLVSLHTGAMRRLPNDHGHHLWLRRQSHLIKANETAIYWIISCMHSFQVTLRSSHTACFVISSSTNAAHAVQLHSKFVSSTPAATQAALAVLPGLVGSPRPVTPPLARGSTPVPDCREQDRAAGLRHQVATLQGVVVRLHEAASGGEDQQHDLAPDTRSHRRSWSAVVVVTG